MTTVRVLYFAGLREAFGVSAEDVTLGQDVATVAALRDQIAGRGEPWSALGRARNLRAAVNQAMADFEAPVKAGDEVAFFPPVTGG